MKRFKVYYIDELVYQSDILVDAIEVAKSWQRGFAYVDVIDTKTKLKVYSWVY